MNNKRYDYLIVGAGLYGAVLANLLSRAGRSCLVIEKRAHIGGNVYTETVEDIPVHMYGAHIFHTNSKIVWDYVNSFAELNNFINCPLANYKGEIYHLPFNMNTFNEMWGVVTPEEARAVIARQTARVGSDEPGNLEEQAIRLVGTDIYERLIKGYTQKQWGRDCSLLPADIIRRLPLRFIYDNNYYNARYQGVPISGYTALIERLLEGSKLMLDTDYLSNRVFFDSSAGHTVYTGPIDAYYGFALGSLQYRSLRFETEVLDIDNYQGNAVVNYTDSDTPYTRIIEHKHFYSGTQPKTVISREYSVEWVRGMEPYYPINDERNSELYTRYRSLAEREPRVTFAGRLGEYRYYDMDTTVELAMETARELLRHG